jgi:ABC-2 type transport system permease protein
MNLMTATWLMTLRALRQSIRQPADEVANVFIPLFFYFVTVGAVGSVAADAFGVADYKGFQLPVAVLSGSAGVASAAGLAMTVDIQSGYFEKLSLTTAPRLALVLGRMVADGLKAVALALLIIALGLAYGSGFATGVAGVLVLLAATFGFTVAYAGAGVAIALKTGSPQAAQAGFILFFPLLFLAPTFAPIEVFATWLEVIARFNPVTYILLGMRSLVTDGWDGAALAKGGGAVAGVAAATLTLTLLALRGRVQQ